LLLALAAAVCPKGSEAADKYNSTPPPRQTYSSPPPARQTYNSSASQSRSYSTGSSQMNTFNSRAVAAPRQSTTSPRPVGTPNSSLTATQKARVNNITKSGVNKGVMTSRLASAAGTKPTIAGTKAPLDPARAKAMNNRLNGQNGQPTQSQVKPNFRALKAKTPDLLHTEKARDATGKARTVALAPASNSTRNVQVGGKGPVQSSMNAKKVFADAHNNTKTTEETRNKKDGKDKPELKPDLSKDPYKRRF
jgi:hypothetical protein